MALSLTATPKSIYQIFSGKNHYITPSYQRAYSWEENQCSELLEDLIIAFEDNDDSYFLGSIVLASSKDKPDILEVIDGQQRLTTLTLLIKVLFMFDEENNDLNEVLYIRASRSKDRDKRRLETNIFVGEDPKLLNEVISFERNDFIKNYQTYSIQNKSVKNKTNRFYKNIFYFYEKIEELQKEHSKEYIYDFIDFLLKEVTLLPITSDAENTEKARDNALMIFETINDRGLNISDTDIIKTKLYTMALNGLKHEEFQKKWIELSEECKNIDYSIDEVFKTYMHIIRGENNISKPESKLRIFFTREKISPFKNRDKKYSDILDDIFKIIEVINFFQDTIKNPQDNNELTKWFQLIKEYSTQYPIISLFVYLYKNGFDNTEELIKFSKYLVKFSYSIYFMSRGQIQFKIYKIIIDIMNNKLLKDTETDSITTPITKEYFQNVGRLKNGYSLLVFYLQDNQEAIYPYYFDKAVNIQDEKSLDNSWNNKDFSEYRDRLGNLLVIDVPNKKIKLTKRVESLECSQLPYMKELLPKINNWSYEDFEQREENLQNILIEFLGNQNEN